ncbi:MAG: T-complex protein 1 subunit theta [Thelocarpon superellum]|nr:MAG: T-complex protein 1 subunit theta [Thelocarpon superellum]
MLNPNFARATGVARTLPKSVLRPRGTVRPSASAPWQRRMASQMGYPRRGPRYESYARVQTLRMLWRSSPVFRYSLLGVGGLGGVYYVQHIEEVPITGRRRFNILSGDDEEQMAVSMYQQTLQQYRGQLLSAHHPATRMVRRVLDRLIPASGLADAEWEVHVILDPEQKNAFVMPGGKVFVFSGILPICDGDDGLAAVLGHEIAHNVAHHAAERMSRMTLLAVCLYPVALLLGAPDFLSQIVLDFGYESEDGAVLRNIDACRAIAQTVQTSLGPYGRNKIVINHLQKMILTSDAATILRELDVVHPAAKLIVMASQQQEAEMGDATNMVIVLAGEMLKKAEDLLRMGLKASDIVQGYEKAQKVAQEALNDLVVDKVKDIRSKEELSKAIRTVVASKQSGSEDFLAGLVAEAVLAVLPKDPSHFNVDNIRVVKIMGSSLEQSRVVKGMVFGREPDGSVQKAKRAKVGVYSCPIDISQTETKGTVLLHNAKEMLDFTKGEEHQLENLVKELHDSGLRVVVAGSTVGELALHYLNRFGILIIKVLSKFELRRLCRVVGATPLARLGAPMPDEMGSVDVVETLEIGGDRVTVFRQENDMTKTATLVLRGATQNHLDDIERAVDDGVNVVKAITRDPRLLPGAGATEMQLVERIGGYGDKTPGLPQYAIRKYAQAFEVIPRTLAESAGLDATEVLSRLYTAHHKTDDWCTGVDVENDDGTGTLDAQEEGILDLLVGKAWAIRLATEAARTVLSVDQIIVARQAGGPKPPGPNPGWDNDD